jgi:RND family efflux transporter MFP subunit
MTFVNAEDRVSKTVTLHDCNIMLIDHVTLAVDKPGILGKITVREGDTVPAKTLVAQLKNDEALAGVVLARKAAASDVEARLAQKTHDVSEAELIQAKQANANIKAVTEYEIRHLQLNVDQTELQFEKAQHDQQLKILELGVALEKLRSHDINSTFEGMVTRVYKSEGEAVQQGDAVVEIVNDRRLRIEGFVPVKEIGRLKIGQKITATMQISNDHPEIVLEGMLQFIDVNVQPVTREVRIWAEVDNSKREFKPGLRATMVIDDNAPIMPPSSNKLDSSK